MNSLLHKNNPSSKSVMLHGKAKPFVQAKLTVNTPGDVYEQEADAMADRVMRMSSNEAHHHRKSMTGLIGRSVQRKCAHCEEEEKRRKPVMRKTEAGDSGMSVSSSFASSLNATKGGGSPLPEGTRSFMENAFSADFSKVKTHIGEQASSMNDTINARAFTTGNDIYFNEGQLSTNTVEGKKLLAHELTHVVQQKSDISNGSIQRYNMDNAPYGDPARDPRVSQQLGSSTTVSGVCGPDITSELSSAISRYTAAYNALSDSQKEEVCDSLTDRQLGPVTWDIVELHNNAWIYRNYRPACATAGAQPPCGSTVRVGSDCYYAGSVNYLIFGVMCRLCDMWKSTMRVLIWLYKSTSGNYQSSLEWAEAGYDGWPSGGTQPAGERNNCLPTCPTPFTGPTFNTRICPHIDPHGQCP